MIQQPELGKKISALRKAKGLTQEELVEKCNLSVRTLQRIEAGEVMPRPNTVRLIFESLEVSFDKTMKGKGLILRWLGQFYTSFIDLFNLRTKTMKKLSILTAMLVIILFSVSSFFNIGKAQNEINPNNTQSEKNVSEDTIITEKFEIAGMFNGWNNDNELIGRDVNCIINGAVIIKSPLLRLNKVTNEIRTPCYTGIFINNAVKITNLKCQPTERIVNSVVVSGDEFIYEGKLVFSDKESIKAGKIIVPRN